MDSYVNRDVNRDVSRYQDYYYLGLPLIYDCFDSQFIQQFRQKLSHTMSWLPLMVFFAANAAGIDQNINEFVQPLTDTVASFIFYKAEIFGMPLIVLLVAAIFFTFYFGFLNIRGFGHALRLTWGDYDNLGNEFLDAILFSKTKTQQNPNSRNSYKISRATHSLVMLRMTAPCGHTI